MLVLTALLVWWFLRTLDVSAVWHAIASAHPVPVLVAVVVTIQTYVLRAWRWQALLAPIGHARYRTAFRTTVIGFATTFLLPGRIGEVLRPYLLAKAEGFNAAAAFATVVIERVLDLISVLLLFVCFLAVTPIDVGRDVMLGGLIAGIGAVAALAVMVFGAAKPDTVTRVAHRLICRLSPTLQVRIAALVTTFTDGLAVMRRPGPLMVAFGLSLLLWLSIALGIWLTSRAFDLTFAFSGSFLIMMFLVVGVAVPTPAGVGSFHWAYRLAVTSFFHAAPDQAAAAALTLHAVSFVPISILGLVFMAQDGLTLTGARALSSTAAASEAAAEGRREVSS